MHLVEKATTTAVRHDPAAKRIDSDVERLAAILRQVAFRADDLIAAVRKSGGARYQDSVRRLERQLRRTQADLEQLEAGMSDRGGPTWRTMDGVARDHPYAAAAASLLTGAALGTLVAMLLTRR